MSHAKFSPSSEHRWGDCAASIALEDGLPDSTSAYAEEGTRAHDAAAKVLQQGLPRVPVEICDNEEMRENVQMYVDSVRTRAYNKTMLIEQKVEFSNTIGVPNQFGTSDAIIVDPATGHVQIIDLKYGMGHRVEPDNNGQMMTYAVAVCETFEEILGIEFKTFELVIIQPRLDHEAGWECDRETLNAHGAKIRAAAAKAEQAIIWHKKGKQLPDEYYSVSQDVCQWCKAKAMCPALSAKVGEAVYDDFAALDNPDTILTQGAPQIPSANQLGPKYGLLGLIEDWCRAIRSEVERRVFSGEQVIGPDGLPFKLVEGKRGNRAWTDETLAEGMLVGILPPEKAYKPREIITASAAAKILDKKRTAEQWKPFKAIITQAPGSPKVALGSDPTPEYSGEAKASEFSDLSLVD